MAPQSPSAWPPNGDQEKGGAEKPKLPPFKAGSRSRSKGSKSRANSKTAALDEDTELESYINLRKADFRNNSLDSAVFTGNVRRSCITGEIIISEYTGKFPNFFLVDLYERGDSIHGKLRDLCKDPYIFRPVAMPHRSWLYSDLFSSRTVIGGGDESGMVRWALWQRCIDAPVNGGRWSPMLSYVPMVLCSALTGDMVIIMIGILVVYIMWYLLGQLNNSEWYNLSRVLTLPVRLLYLLVLLLRMEAVSGGLSVLGLLATLSIYMADLVIGDLVQVMCYKLTCQYELANSLPGRVFVCRRTGAASFERLFGSRGQVSHLVSGLAAWPSNYAIIADIHGLLMELRPMRPEDWKQVQARVMGQDEEGLFYATNTFTDEIPDVVTLEKLRRKQARTAMDEFMEKVAKQQAKDSKGGTKLKVEDA